MDRIKNSSEQHLVSASGLSICDVTEAPDETQNNKSTHWRKLDEMFRVSTSQKSNNNLYLSNKDIWCSHVATSFLLRGKLRGEDEEIPYKTSLMESRNYSSLNWLRILVKFPKPKYKSAQ
jgi:hypothetical protein